MLCAKLAVLKIVPEDHPNQHTYAGICDVSESSFTTAWDIDSDGAATFDMAGNDHFASMAQTVPVSPAHLDSHQQHVTTPAGDADGWSGKSFTVDHCLVSTTPSSPSLFLVCLPLMHVTAVIFCQVRQSKMNLGWS